MSEQGMRCGLSAENHFGPGVLPCRRDFDFTLLFEQTILGLVPDLLFLVLCAFRWQQIYGRATKVRQSFLGVWKTALIALLLAVKVANLVLWSLPRAPRTNVSIPSAAVSLTSTLALLILSHYEHTRSLRPSTLICLYLIATTLFNIVQVRTLWLIRPLDFRLAVTASLALGIRTLLLISEARGKKSSFRSKDDHFSPEIGTGIFGRSVYWWLNQLFLSGKQQKRHVLLRRVVGELKWTLAAAAAPRICLIGFKFAQPFLINVLIKYVSDHGRDEPSGARYGFGGATVLIYVGLAVSNGLYKRQTIRMITMIRARLVGMIYAQTLHQASDPVETTSVTLMSTDVDRITTGMLNIHELWASAAEIIIALSLLSTTIGYPSVAALVFASLSVLQSAYIAPQMRLRQRAWVRAVQERISFTSAILKGMRQVKMFGIEPTVESKINRLREAELESSKPYWSLIVWVNVLGAVSTALAPAATIAVYAGTQLNLKLETPKTDLVFTSLSLISLLTNPVVLISVSSTRFTSAIGCFDRIQDFLSTEGKSHHTDQSMMMGSSGIEMSLMANSQELVSMEGASFRLPTGSSNVLEAVNLKIRPSSLSVVTGPLGCGKSSLLKAILGELNTTQGRISIAPVRMAYCQQDPWIFNGTLQTNIIGESPMDEKWLKEVVHACNLEVDVARLPSGLDTVVGSSGSQLSGGQKQRVALARALYAKPDLLLLDDVLSALDAVTCKRVCQRVFGPSGLVRKLGLATVLATTAVDCFKEADNVIVLSSDGRIADQESLEELLGRNQYIQELFCRTHSKEDKEDEDTETSFNETQTGPDNGPRATQGTTPTRTRGTGDLSLYAYYIKSFGWWAFAFTLTFATLYVQRFTALTFDTELMLTWWAESNPRNNYAYLGSYIAVSTVAIAAMVSIPQHPLVITGSVRESLSLGATAAINDSAMISGPSSVHLWPQILEQGGLDADVQFIHMSNGQQQLLGIARALLLPGRLVILDEPTSGFDEQTEKLVQGILREGFKDRTVICVAHRIGTLMDSDVIIVMSEGSIFEMGTPEELLGRKGAFWELYHSRA
ncbi:P-loop containing nucleoside triphosphate hydrolase protein [Aspergillus ibericus CBS 121593]|uniref:P-loop containing nucleoside triphosphate hydrolase protein n=1 Tax=Aspergillus ibericus CBS 121593 TaxID=1448316 RepID=A0A395H3Y1_9EURO|nr:P-loop containing nucleoside triphosphate hydrolase protein [Aspergillus ibericus CBS 121593]RAL02582.1 P-loop containing nucleoside triphosphate hydrolase protein [Aspergillus ibericus CBS 121593]